MTAMVQSRGGGGVLVCALAAGLVMVLAVPALSRVADTLEAAQPVPPQPTLAPPPALYAGGLGTVMLADVGTMEWPEGGDVVITDHPQIKHGEDVANAVRTFMAAYIAAHPVFGNQPPCDDDRYRFMAEMEPGVWGLWVLEKIGDKLFREKTAFQGTQEYIKSVRDKCGKKNSDWFGHAYAQ